VLARAVLMERQRGLKDPKAWRARRVRQVARVSHEEPAAAPAFQFCEAGVWMVLKAPLESLTAEQAFP